MNYDNGLVLPLDAFARKTAAAQRNGEAMIILGIDPGYAIVGWGVIEYSGSKFRTLGYGSIQTPAGMQVNNSRSL